MRGRDSNQNVPSAAAGVSNGSVKPSHRGFPVASPATTYTPAAPSQPMTLPPLPPCNVPAPMPFTLPAASTPSAPTASTASPAPGAFPFVMPPFMIPPWVPASGKMPSNPAEFMAYQQQFQQYQQFMMQQYQVFMMQQQQQQQQQQQHVPTQQAPSPLPLSSMALPTPTTSTTTTGSTRSSLDALNIDGPPLLKHVAVEKPKRARKPRSESGRGKAQSASCIDDVLYQADEESQGGRPASAAQSGLLDETSRGLSYFHDQESLFSLLMPGNSIAYADPSLSIPGFDQESAGSNSQSQASLLSLVRAAASEVSVRTQPTTTASAGGNTNTERNRSVPTDGVFASLASATANNHSAHSTGITKPAPTGLKQAPASIAVHNVSSRPKKKTIKPTLIGSSSNSNSTGTAGVFDATRASPAFSLAVAAGPVRTTSASPRNSAVTTSIHTAAAPTATGKNPTSTVPAMQDERSMLEFDGLSNFNWAEGSRQGAERDGGLLHESSLHSPLLDGASLLDASRFEFSRLSHFPHELSSSAAEEGGAKQHAVSGKKRKEPRNQTDKTAKKPKSATSVKERAHSSSTTTTATTTVAVDDANAFPFEETSNMSLLGEIFNDTTDGAAGRGVGQHADFSNLSNLLSLSGSPNKLSFLGGSRMTGSSRAGVGSRSGTGRKKRSLDVTKAEHSSSNGGENKSEKTSSASGSVALPRAFKHIASNKQAEPAPAAATTATPAAPTANVLRSDQNSSGEPSAKKPRPQPSAGIFATVMAQVQQQQ